MRALIRNVRRVGRSASSAAPPWGGQAVTNARFAGGIGLAFSVVTALLSWAFVKAEWLRSWGYAFPAGLAFAALLRLAILASEL
ncbi:hypothetical protein GCM10010207_38180 [Streptomyces atratus]|nr:hypothetical protein GCM10010207_38180 [Streptomyces atratus]